MVVAPSEIPRLFEPFVQAAQGLDRSRGGLGLAMARSLIELHHGHIEVYSDGPGRGTAPIATMSWFMNDRGLDDTGCQVMREVHFPCRPVPAHAGEMRHMRTTACAVSTHLAIPTAVAVSSMEADLARGRAAAPHAAAHGAWQKTSDSPTKDRGGLHDGF